MTTTPRPNSLMTLKEAADFLRVSTRTLQRLIKDRRLGAIRVGRQLRFWRSDVENFR
jgi:excisionase family DNA binding protein